TVPSWFSEMLPLSFDLSLEIGKLRRLLEEKFKAKKSRKEIIDFANEYLYVDENAANSIYEFFYEQFLFSEIPHDKKIIIETYEENNGYYYVFHTLFGRRVNDALSRGVALAISRMQHRDVNIGINDNGFFIYSAKKIQAKNAFAVLKSEQFRKITETAVDKTEILARRFRHCAARALMILRRYKGREKRVGRQQVSSMILMNAVKRISNEFCILKEARREVLEDLMDVDNAILVLKAIEEGKIKVKEIRTKMPGPFSFNLVSQGYADTLKIEDKIEFLKRMHQLVLAKIGKDRTF
ncbi:MAG TPA: ATP-dependent helicase, partial [Candidatus Nanoarchaeia archaeon]|nr:ATP-dependent helicase [Candidatus Nanoarchaeia archaeon]